MRLRHYLELGMSRIAIAEELGIDRRTIHRWIASGQLDREVTQPTRFGPWEPPVRKLDPYRYYVRHGLETYPELTAARLLEELRACGYSGGSIQLKEFVREGGRASGLRTDPAGRVSLQGSWGRLPPGRRAARMAD